MRHLCQILQVSYTIRYLLPVAAKKHTFPNTSLFVPHDSDGFNVTTVFKLGSERFVLESERQVSNEYGQLRVMNEASGVAAGHTQVVAV